MLGVLLAAREEGRDHVVVASAEHHAVLDAAAPVRLALERALAAYKQAERYAPSGESRRDRIEALEAEIEARRNTGGR